MVAAGGHATYKGPTTMSDPGGPRAATTTTSTRGRVIADPKPDGRRRWGRPRSRQARVVIRKVGPWSVLKFSFLFYLCIWTVIMGALVILYGVLGAVGVLDSVQRLIRELFAEPTFEIQGQWLFSRGVLLALAMVVLWTLVNLFVALLYNLISDIVGGIEVTLSERR
jgi:hypothetical protein